MVRTPFVERQRGAACGKQGGIERLDQRQCFNPREEGVGPCRHGLCGLCGGGLHQRETGAKESEGGGRPAEIFHGDPVCCCNAAPEAGKRKERRKTTALWQVASPRQCREDGYADANAYAE